MPTRFVQITDLHLSDRTDSTTYQALLWAVQKTNALVPNFVMVSGDMTTYGTKTSAQNTLEALKALKAPTFFTNGNAEHRSEGACPIFAPYQTQTSHTHNGVQFHFIDTSQGKITEADRAHLQTISQSQERVIVTHYPIDTLDENSRNWITTYLHNHAVECYVAGHKHIHRTREIGSCQEIITRGLDPDKASGHLPGISLFERSENGNWTEAFIPWQYTIALQPCDIHHLPSPVGWSMPGDPIIATQKTRATDFNVFEIRPNKLDFSATALKTEITSLRNNRPLYLSWHLPNLSWNTETNTIDGISEIINHTALAQEIGVNHLTVHVPQISANLMTEENWALFEDVYENIFRQAVSQGIRLAIENVHNKVGVQPTDPACKFATDIPTYLKWLATLQKRFANIPNAQVGAHFDVGHARNNGEYGNMYPLADWYAQVGPHILGYHIHQIRTHPETKKLENHKEMFSLFEQRISYAGFLHAWSTQQINRAPLFVEIRNLDALHRSAQRLHNLFLNADHYSTSLDLPLTFAK